jgi:hypothetical protein
MKKITSILFMLFFVTNSFSQSATKEFNIEHSFKINLPTYMNRTVGLNEVASLQYKNVVKDIYGLVIADYKDELELAEMNYSSINEYLEESLKTFLDDEPSKKTSNPIYKKIGEQNFGEFDASYYDEEEKVEIYYLFGIVETKTSFYKVLSWCSSLEKEKYKEDFRKILYSLKD